MLYKKYSNKKTRLTSFYNLNKNPKNPIYKKIYKKMYNNNSYFLNKNVT